ncbi:hypothetical protein RB595_005221 [Gaeumannomyces hyphopodioides]
MESLPIGSPDTSEPRDGPGGQSPDIFVTPPLDSHRDPNRNYSPVRRSESRHSSLRSDDASSISLNSQQPPSGTRLRDSEAVIGAIQGYGLPSIDRSSVHATDIPTIEATAGTHGETRTADVAHPESTQRNTSPQEAGLSASELRTHLLRAFDGSSEYLEPKFLPHGALESLINEENVFSALMSSGSLDLLTPAQQRQRRSRIPARPGKRLHDYPDEIRELARRIVSPVSQSQPQALGQLELCGRGGYRKIFAILVLIKEIGHIRRFVDYDEVCDDDLPLTTTRKGRGKRSPKLAIPSADQERDHEPLECARRLGIFAVRAFIKRQKWMSVASLKGDHSVVPYFEFQSHEILPWRSKNEVYLLGHHPVFRVKIHKDHYHFPHYDSGSDKRKDHDRWYCLKFFKQKNDFHSEVTIAKQFRSERHKHAHIGQVVASFSHGDDHAMVLPWAESDLFKFWKQNEPGPESALWMVQQCSGIVGGLRKIHFYTSGLDSEVGSHRHPISARSVPEAVGAKPLRPTSRRMCCAHSYRHRPPEPPQPPLPSSGAASFTFSDTTHGNTAEAAGISQGVWYGRHGDIKPQNILWFPSSADEQAEGEDGVSEGGILRIIDFGTSEFSRTKAYGEVRDTATYRSPESDTGRPLSSLCDIWALGCMIVEFVTWYFHGWAGVAQFEKDRLSADKIFSPQKGKVQTAVFF